MDTEFGDIGIFEVTPRGCGMTMFTVHQLLEEIHKHPGRKIYVNFELPKAAKKTIEKYATIEKVNAEHQDD